mmetsp:Transcript_68808/g.190494  ORF Transcript_68808/g.190494 Transcript_68808/m.190494 type:complete len:630 (+) Transcript_68808:1-1890(+)
MEDVVQRLAKEEAMHLVEVESWRVAVDALRVDCQKWEEIASQESNEAVLQGCRAEKAQQSADEAVQRMEEALKSMNEARLHLTEEAAQKDEEERQRWLALEAWQAADDAKTAMQLRMRQLEMDHCRLEEDLQAARTELREHLARWQEGDESTRMGRAEEAAACRELTLALERSEHEASRLREEGAALHVEPISRRACQVLGRCMGRRGLHEARELVSELQRWTEEAREREVEAQRVAEEQAAARQGLEAAQREVRSEQEALAAQALQTAFAQEREEALEMASFARQHDEAAAAQRREEATHPAGALLCNVPLAVRVPSYDIKKEGLASRIIYTVVVEGPGTSETLTRQFAEFRELHEQLNAKPFASTLHARPQDWFFAHFSTTMLERQRRQLEAYLAFLCAHSHVLLDTTIWRWLAADDLTQVVVRLVAASDVQWANEVCRLVQAMEAVLVAGGDESRCVHPSVMRVLREVLLDDGDQAAQAAACRLLERLLTGSHRARQLFLAPEAGGASALVSVFRCGPQAGQAASDAVWRILEVLSVAEAEGTRRLEAQELETRARNEEAEERRRRPAEEPGPGECCVCLDRGKSHALLPCGHLCACMDCAAYLAARAESCPVCRCPIERAVQIFV